MANENKRLIERLSWEKIIAPHHLLTEPGSPNRARLSSSLSLGIAILHVLAALASYLFSASKISVIVIILAAGTLCIFAYVFSRQRKFKIGCAILSCTIAISPYLYILSGASNPTPLLITFATISLIIGGMLLSIWAVLALLIGNLVAVLTIPHLITTTFTLADSLMVAVAVSCFGILLIISMIFNNTYERKSRHEINQTNTSLQEIKNSLIQQVDDRESQYHLLVEISKNIPSVKNIDELLNYIARQLVGRFKYLHASIFLLDETGQFANLRASDGISRNNNTEEQIPLNSTSVISWVITNKELYRTSTNLDNSPNIMQEMLHENNYEICAPIVHGSKALGAVHVQTPQPERLNEESLMIIQSLAGQIAVAINNSASSDYTKMDLQNFNEVMNASNSIAQAQKEDDLYSAVQRVFENTPYIGILLVTESGGMRVAAGPDYLLEKERAGSWGMLDIQESALPANFISGVVVGSISDFSTMPPDFLKILDGFNFGKAGVIPVLRASRLAALLIVASKGGEIITHDSIRPFLNIAELTISTIERIRAEKNIEQRLSELESIAMTSQAISTSSDIHSLFSILHEHIREKMGDINFLVAIYEPSTNSINIPYLYEKGENITRLESFPLGEGLTSILIRTKQPLMIVEDTERRAIALGAKVVGQPAKSWLGAPLIVAGDVLGAMIAQDVENEYAFDDGDLRFMSTLSSQVAGAIYNIRLLDETRRRAVQLQTASEIARDISGSLDINELLVEAVSLIRERFNFYHASIFLLDGTGEYAVIREATGEAGAQMKRAGHKLKVGSKSIVGYVTSSGEPLVVNDITRDATYFANPLLPDTRSEIAIPLKVGARTLGALDVQSNQPYSFSEEDINVLRILADQLSIAVVNSELFAETQEHLSQHRLLHHVTTAAASGTTLDEALASAAQGLQVTLGGDRVAILLANREKQMLEVRAVAGYSEEVKQITVPFGEGVTGWVAVNHQPQRIDDVLKDPRYIQAGANIRSELALPMVYRGEVLGVLNVESDQPSAYSENDEELLGTLGGSLAAIIANARLLEQIRHQADRERLLFEVTSKIRRSTDIQTIMATTATELSKALGARRAGIKIAVDSDSFVQKENNDE